MEGFLCVAKGKSDLTFSQPQPFKDLFQKVTDAIPVQQVFVLIPDNEGGFVMRPAGVLELTFRAFDEVQVEIQPPTVRVVSPPPEVPAAKPKAKSKPAAKPSSKPQTKPPGKGRLSIDGVIPATSADANDPSLVQLNGWND